MKLDELLANETSDEVMQKYYDMIKEAYSNGEDCVELPEEELSLVQFNYLQDVKGYTMENNPYTNKDIISGW